MDKLIARTEKWLIDTIDRVTGRVDRDPGAWQREIDRRFTLELDLERNQFSLSDEGKRTTTFIWDDVVEIQSLHRIEFPPLMWNIITEEGNWLIPEGGRYAEALTDRIYALPDYQTQEVVKISPPAGYNSASSIWRRDDHFPKRNPSDFSEFW